MYQYNNPLLSQYQAQLNSLRNKYNEELKNIQEGIRREESNIRGQFQGAPAPQPSPVQQPVPEQPATEMQPVIIPNDIKILAVLGDIKGILERAFPKAEAAGETVIQPEPAKADVPEAADDVKPEPKLKKNEGTKG